LTYQYGIPTSLRNTGQQWDFPNAWAPLQDLVIRGKKGTADRSISLVWKTLPPPLHANPRPGIKNMGSTGSERRSEGLDLLALGRQRPKLSCPGWGL
jgi:hypothetical protein